MKTSTLSRFSKSSTLVDLLIVVGFWSLMYAPIWIGARHVGYDMDGFNYPLDRFLMNGLAASGHLPTWDWFSYNGIDFAGNVQAATYYPPKILFEAFLAIVHARLNYPLYQVFALLHVLGLSLSAYFVARSVKLPRFWCIAGTLILTYTGILQAQIQHFWYIAALPWLPLIVYGAFIATTERKLNGVYLYVVASVCLSLVGYPLQYLTIQVETLAFVLIYRLSQSLSVRSFAEPLLGFACCQAIVMLTSAVSLLPFAMLERSSIADALRGPLPPEAALTLILPDVFGHLSGAFTLGADATTSYFFPGFVVELAFVALLAARRSIVKSPRSFLIAALFLFANAALEFVPLGDLGLSRIPGFDFIRPQSAGMPFALAFASLAVLILVAADRTLAGRFRSTLRIGTVIACASLFINRPGYFNTPTGPATDVDANSAGFVQGASPGTTFSMAIDQSTVGGSADNWPRVLGLRTLGGEDPLAQRPYLDLLDSKGLHNSGRRVFFSDDADFKWLQANGVGFVLSTSPKLLALATREHWRVVQQAPNLPMFALPEAAPVARATCAKAVSANFGIDEMTVHYEMPSPLCTIRLTTNYNPNFTASGSALLTPLAGELGMNLSHLPANARDVRISYVNPSVVIGRWLTALGLLLIAGSFFARNALSMKSLA